MNKRFFSHPIRTLVLIALLLSLVGCSDMLDRLGNIALTITLDTPEVEVSSYRLEATQATGSAAITPQTISPPSHILSAMQKGTWNLRVTAFNAQGTQIGIGTQSVALKEGQIAEATILVVFSQEAPSLQNLTLSGPARYNAPQGSISGTTAAMEYQRDGDTTYTTCREDTTPLTVGTYRIRYAASHGLAASEPLTVTVPSFEPIQLMIADPTLTTTKTYDGTAEVIGTLSLGTISGVQEGDDVTVHAQASYDTAAVGSGKTITVSYSLNGADAPNYLKPVDARVSGDIERKPLSVSAAVVTASKEYDNTSTAQVLSAGTLSGVLEGESVTFQALATYQSLSVGSDIPMYVTYTLAGEHAGNYLAPDRQSAGVGQITKKQLTIASPILERNKTYDGTTGIIGTVIPGSLTGVAAGDTLTVGTTALYDSKNAGTSKSITVTYTLGGAASENYLKPDDTTGLTGEIRKRSLQVSSIGVQTTKVYDGTQSVVVTQEGTLQNKVEGDDVTVTMLAEYDNKSAGTGKIIGASFSLAGEDRDNYVKPDNMNLTSNAEITKRALNITGTTISTTKTYDGTTQAAGPSIGTMTGVLEEDSVSVDATAAYDSLTAGTGKTITITYMLSGSDALNYTLPPETRTGASITKASLQGSLTITGITDYGQVLGIVSNLTAGVPVTYQWKRNGIAIEGATGTTYTLKTEDIGNPITVTATAVSSSHEGSITSAATAFVAKGAGEALPYTLVGYYPATPAAQTIINITGFSQNLSGIEANVALNGSSYAGFFDLEVDSRGRAMVQPGPLVTTAAKMQFRTKETSTTLAGPIQEISISEQELGIGDYYAGGIVGIIYTSGDSGYVLGEIHGLIAAKTDTTPASALWSSSYSLAGTTSIGIGTGAANTSAIIAALDSTETVPYAASIAHAYTDGTYTDWFLPSHEELLRLRSNKLLIGNFDMSKTYWSSSQSTQVGYIPENHAHVAPFNQPIMHWVNHKDYPSNIRATRYF